MRSFFRPSLFANQVRLMMPASTDTTDHDQFIKQALLKAASESESILSDIETLFSELDQYETRNKMPSELLDEITAFKSLRDCVEAVSSSSSLPEMLKSLSEYGYTNKFRVTVGPGTRPERNIVNMVPHIMVIVEEIFQK